MGSEPRSPGVRICSALTDPVCSNNSHRVWIEMSIAPNLQPFIFYHLRIIGFRWIKIPFLTLKYFLSPWTTKSIFIICWSGAHLTKVTVNSVNYSVWICVLFLSTAFCNLRDCNTYICKTLFIQSTRSVWWHVSMFLWLKTPLHCSSDVLQKHWEYQTKLSSREFLEGIACIYAKKK